MITATAPVPKRVKLVVVIGVIVVAIGVAVVLDWVLKLVVPVELEDKILSLIFLRWVRMLSSLFPHF